MLIISISHFYLAIFLDWIQYKLPLQINLTNRSLCATQRPNEVMGYKFGKRFFVMIPNRNLQSVRHPDGIAVDVLNIVVGNDKTAMKLQKPFYAAE